jgi:hypothetical protein
MYDGDALTTDDPSQHDQPQDHPTQSDNVTVPSWRLGFSGLKFFTDRE